MSTKNGPFPKSEETEKTITLLYTTGFRLTGNHQSAALLVHKTLCIFEKQKNRRDACWGNLQTNGMLKPDEAIKKLCRVFIENDTSALRQQTTYSYNDHGPNCSKNGGYRAQEALLKLEPGKRAVLVLRDILGLTYAEIAGVTMSNEKDVAQKIASARRILKKILASAIVLF